MTEPVVPPDKKRELGLYRKYNVTRTDGKGAAGEKHDGCDYFVLDLQCDPHAIPALRAYAASAKADGYHQLAYDLRQRIGDIPTDLNRDPRQPVPREVLEQPDAVARPALPAPEPPPYKGPVSETEATRALAIALADGFREQGISTTDSAAALIAQRDELVGQVARLRGALEDVALVCGAKAADRIRAFLREVA